MRIHRTIDNDTAIVQNYQKPTAETFDIYDLKNPIMSDAFVDSIINLVSKPISKLFTDLERNGLSSGGEKAAFDLVLDLVIAKKVYDDTIFCIDEPEGHMNARIQAELLSVLYEVLSR